MVWGSSPPHIERTNLKKPAPRAWGGLEYLFHGEPRHRHPVQLKRTERGRSCAFRHLIRVRWPELCLLDFREQQLSDQTAIPESLAPVNRHTGGYGQSAITAWKAAKLRMSFFKRNRGRVGFSSCHFFFGLPLLPRLCRALIVVCPAEL